MSNSKEQFNLQYEATQVVQSNRLIATSQPVNLHTKKLLCYEISKIKKGDLDFAEHSYTNDEISKIIGVPADGPGSHIYRAVTKIRNELMNNRFIILNRESEEEFMINLMSYTKKNRGGLTIKLNDDLKSFLLNLSGNFTALDCEVIVRFKTYYGLRLYELLQSDLYKSHVIQYSLKELRRYLNCEKKYQQLSGLREYVLDVAIEDIKQATSESVSYTFGKENGVYSFVSFVVEKPKRKKQKSANEKSKKEDVDIENIFRKVE